MRVSPFVAAAPRAPGAPVGVALGTMNFGKRTPEAEARRIVRRAVERGVSVLDTANVYGDGESERIVGRALAEIRADVFVATKVGALRRGGANEGLSPARIREAIDESRGRLGRDVVDLYYLHVPDPATPLEASTEAMCGLAQAGKIAAWGLSNHASWQVLEACLAADRAGGPRPVVCQMLHNVLVRQLEIEFFAFAAKYGLHTTVYNPLAGGLLSGRYASASAAPPGSRFHKNPMYQRRYFSDRLLELVRAFAELAAQAGISLVALSYAWLAGRAGVSSVLVGPGSVAHLDEALDALEAPLSDDVARAVDDAWAAFQGTDARYAR